MDKSTRRFFSLALIFLAAVSVAGFTSCAMNANPVDTSDPAITARVKAEFKSHPELDVHYLDISVNDGIVTISGAVDSDEAREQAADLVSRVRGVKDVIVNVLVQE